MYNHRNYLFLRSPLKLDPNRKYYPATYFTTYLCLRGSNCPHISAALICISVSQIVSGFPPGVKGQRRTPTPITNLSGAGILALRHTSLTPARSTIILRTTMHRKMKRDSTKHEESLRLLWRHGYLPEFFGVCYAVGPKLPSAFRHGVSFIVQLLRSGAFFFGEWQGDAVSKDFK